MKKVLTKSISLVLIASLLFGNQYTIANAEESTNYEINETEETIVIDGVSSDTAYDFDESYNIDDEENTAEWHIDGPEPPSEPYIATATDASIATSTDASLSIDSCTVMASTVKSYTINSKITATLDSDGVLNIRGEGDMPDYVATDSMPWFNEASSITKISVNQGITSIGRNNFCKAQNCTSVWISNTVTQIGSGAFAECPIASINGAANVKSFGTYAFKGSKVTSYTFPGNTETINLGVFFDNSSLTSITIPSNVSNIEGLTYGCRQISSINVDSQNPTYETYNGVVYKKGKSGKKLVIACPTAKTSISFAPEVSEISGYAFASSSIKNIVLPDTITFIGDYAFIDCQNLTQCTLSNALNFLNWGAFKDCTSLLEITIPDNITTIYTNTFNGCTSLSYVKLPANVEKISRWAFKNTQLTQVTIPKSAKSIEKEAFPNNTELIFESDMVKLSNGAYIKGTQAPISVQYKYDYAFQTLNLINSERQKNNLTALTMDKTMLDAATKRAIEISTNFSHTKPTGDDYNADDSNIAAENIAISTSPQNAVNEWMSQSSSTYTNNKNILNSSYKSAGIGTVYVDGHYYFVLCFGKNTATSVTSSGYTNTTDTVDVDFSYDKVRFSANQDKFQGEIGTQIGTFRLCFNNGQYLVPIEPYAVSYAPNNYSSCTIDDNGNIVGTLHGTSYIRCTLKNCEDAYATSCVYVTDSTPMPDTLQVSGIYVFGSDVNGIYAGTVINNLTEAQKKKVTYKYYMSNDNGATWYAVTSTKTGDEYLNYKPEKQIFGTIYGDYLIRVVVSTVDNSSTTYEAQSTTVSYHPYIKGICQMPYTGKGGGYLIGIESFDNPNNEYRYEMLILDCTLLAQGKNAWTYSTGKCKTSGNCLWTIWQPQYGYYWTLFRVYDKNGNIIDERCYGFENIC